MKTDFKKTFPAYKAKKEKFEFLDVPPMNYLMVDGGGGPASEDFAAAIEALYPLAYALKFFSKQELQNDYVVPPLEALWWADDMSVFTTRFDQTLWDWTAMILLPDWIPAESVEVVRERVKQKAAAKAGSKKLPRSLDLVRLERLEEGRCLQTLHLGPYSSEGPVLKRMHEQLIPEGGYGMTGKHHEIYFNDFRKVAPEKLRTILRQPVLPLEG